MSVENSLVVKTILTDEFKFNDAQGATNKPTILNRVKKMDQSERNELLRDLDAVVKNVNPTATPPSLNERAVCTLLLADDGKAPTDWCWLARVVIWVRNRLGRTSSAEVMTKLEQTIGVLNTNTVQPAPMNVKTELGVQMTALQTQIDDRTKENNVKSLLQYVDYNIRSKLSPLFEADWNAVGTFVDLETTLELLEQDAGLKVTDDTVKAFISKTKANVLDLIEKRKDYRYRSEVITAISLQLRYMEVKIEDHLSSIHDEKKQLQKEKELVKKRLENYENNVKNADERKNFSAAKNQIGGAAAQIRNLNQIIDIIDRLAAKKEKASLHVLAAFIKSSNLHLQAAHDSINNTQKFADHFALLAKFAANDASLNKQHLADVIDPKLLTKSSDAALAKRLFDFQSNPNGYSADDLKKQVINDIVAYWKIVFDQLKAQQLQLLDDGKTKIKNPVPAPVPAPAPAPAPAPTPAPVATPAPAPLYPAALASPPVHAPSSTLPALFAIPTTASDHLKNKAAAADKTKVTTSIATLHTVATNLQHVRENQSSDYGYYMQINANRIDNGILQAVYANFYWIMKDKLGMLESDNNWGGNVFTTGKTASGAAPAIDRPLLNHYRVQAIVEALNGHFRKGENQNPTS
jgi:hypothetical protein